MGSPDAVSHEGGGDDVEHDSEGVEDLDPDGEAGCEYGVGWGYFAV